MDSPLRPERLSGILSAMRARDFGRHFRKHTDKLKPGETLEITKPGQPHGLYTRVGPAPKKFPATYPDFSGCGYTKKQGQAFIDRVIKDQA